MILTIVYIALNAILLKALIWGHDSVLEVYGEAMNRCRRSPDPSEIKKFRKQWMGLSAFVLVGFNLLWIIAV